MKPMELIRVLDSGIVEELKLYYNGQKTVVNIHNIPKTMPDYEVSKLWNSEDGKGISVLLADNTDKGGEEE